MSGHLEASHWIVCEVHLGRDAARLFWVSKQEICLSEMLLEFLFLFLL